jgi:hypothetical protein
MTDFQTMQRIESERRVANLLQMPSEEVPPIELREVIAGVLVTLAIAVVVAAVWI